MAFEDDKAELIEAKIEDRRCTDVPCCILFAIFCIGLIYIFIVGCSEGHIPRLYKGLNFAGKVCGFDTGVKNKPYLYYPTSPEPPYGIDLDTPLCVERCFTQEDANAGVTIKYPSRRDLETESVDTVSMVVQSTPVAVYATKLVMNSVCAPIEGSLADKVARGSESTTHFRQFQESIGGIGTAWPLMLACIGLALLLCVIYAICLRYCVNLLIVAVCGTAVTLLVLLGIGLIVAGAYGLSSGIIRRHLQSDAAVMCIVIGTLLLVLAVVVALVVVCSWDNMKICIALLEAATEVVEDMPSILFAPVVTGALQILWVSFWIWGILLLVSSGKAHAREIQMSWDDNGGATVEGMHRVLEWDHNMAFMIIYWVIGLVWILEMIHAFGQFVVSYTVVIWYFTAPDASGARGVYLGAPVFMGMLQGVLYHVGTFALGGFLISIFRPIHLLFFWASRKAQATGNEVAPDDRRCDCCVDCFQSFVEVVSKNAYIEVALSSKDFCRASQASFRRLLHAPYTILLLNGTSRFLTFLGALVVALICACVTYICLENMEAFTSPTSNYFVSDPNAAAAIIGLLSAFLAMGFLNVWDQTADCLLYCFLVEGTDEMHGDSNYTLNNKIYAPQELKYLLEEHGIFQ